MKRLVPYQTRLIGADWYDPDTKSALVRTVIKARRIGMSTAAGYTAAFWAAGRQAVRGSSIYRQLEPINVHVVSKDWDGAKNLMQEIADACDSLAPHDSAFRIDATATKIRFLETGCEIKAHSCKPNRIRSSGGAWILDEFCFWPQAEAMWGAVRSAASATLKSGRGGYPMCIISTPWDADSLPFRIFTEGGVTAEDWLNGRRPDAEGFPFVRHRIDIHDAVRDGFPIDVEAERQKIGIPEIFEMELLCKFRHAGQSFFPIAKLRDCQVFDPTPDEEGFEADGGGLPDGWERAPAYFGIDIGGGVGRDNTAIVQWRAIGDQDWVVGVRAFNRLDHVHQADVVEAWINSSAPAGVPVTVAVDHGSDGKPMISELRRRFLSRRRFNVAGIGMSPSEQELHATKLRQALERNRVRIYAGTAAGGDDDGARAMMLELSAIKAKLAGGKLRFETPRDPGKGHCDRAWAAMFGRSRMDGASSMGGPSAGSTTFANVGTYSHDHEGLGFG